MNILVGAGNVVFAAGTNLTAAEVAAQRSGWCSDYDSWGAITVYTGVTLPAGFVPGCFTYSGGVFTAIPAQQVNVDAEVMRAKTKASLSASNVVAVTGILNDGFTNVGFDVSWNAVTTSRWYELRYRTSGGAYATVVVPDSGAATTGVRIMGLLAGTSYTMSLRAYTMWGSTDWTPDVVKTTSSALATSLYSEMTSDDKFTAVEKASFKPQFDSFVAEQAGIDASATNAGITTAKTAYDTALSTLVTFVNTTKPLFSSMTATTDLGAGGGATLRGYIQDLITKKQALINAISDVTYVKANSAIIGKTNPFFEDGKNLWDGISDAAVTVVTTGLIGGKAINVPGYHSMFSTNMVAVDTNRVYKGRLRIRQMAKVTTPKFYAGVACYDAAGNFLAGGTYHYFIVAGATLAANSAWTVYEATITGTSATYNGVNFAVGTAYVRVMALINHGGGATDVQEVDSLEFFDITESVWANIPSRPTDAQLLNSQQLWSQVQSVPSNVNNATVNLTLKPIINVSVQGNNVTKTAGAANTWDASAYSLEAFTGGVCLTFMAGQVNLNFMAGINTDPATDNTYTSIDHAWYCTTSGSSLIYEGGSSKGTFGTYTVDTVFSIVCDCVSVKYYKDGVLIYTSLNSTNDATKKWYFDCSIHGLNASINKITLGPATNNLWSSVGGTGKPADNADVTTSALNNGSTTPVVINRPTKVSGQALVYVPPGTSDMSNYASRIAQGIASHGTYISLIPAFYTTPKILLSPSRVPTYSSNFGAANSQSLFLEATEVTKDGFRINAYLFMTSAASYNVNTTTAANLSALNAYATLSSGQLCIGNAKATFYLLVKPYTNLTISGQYDEIQDATLYTWTYTTKTYTIDVSVYVGYNTTNVVPTTWTLIGTYRSVTDVEKTFTVTAATANPITTNKYTFFKVVVSAVSIGTAHTIVDQGWDNASGDSSTNYTPSFAVNKIDGAFQTGAFTQEVIQDVYYIAIDGGTL